MTKANKSAELEAIAAMFEEQQLLFGDLPLTNPTKKQIAAEFKRHLD